MDPYGRLFTHLLFPAWETWVRRRPTLTLAKRLERTQYSSLDELAAQQVSELRVLLSHAWENVPYYRSRFTEAGFHPDDFRSLEDLQRVPLLTRAEAAADPAGRTSRVGPKVAVRKGTSGSSGQPLHFGYEKNSDHWRMAIKLRGYRWAGHWPGMKTLYYWGAASPFRSRYASYKAELDHRVKRARYIDCGRRSPDDLDRAIKQLRAFRPEAIVCFSQAGADLARRVLETGTREAYGTTVICGAERVLPADREAMVQAFGPKVFETYGCREVMLMASECEQHAGLHVSMENIVVEVLVKETDGQGRPVYRAAKPGETGEVVITDLHNLAMPFIRYANGDVAEAGPASRCACGRTLPRLGAVEGRVAETLVDGKGNRVNGLIFNVLIAHVANAIRQFQAVQRKDGSIVLRVVPTAGFDDSVEGNLREVWNRYLPDVRFELEKVGAIDTERSGKRRVVIVEK